MYLAVAGNSWRSMRRRFDWWLSRKSLGESGVAIVRRAAWPAFVTLCSVLVISVLFDPLHISDDDDVALVGATAGGDGGVSRFIVLYLACNADGILGATVSARSVLGQGFSHDVGMLAVRSYVSENETAQFDALSPRSHVVWVDELSNPAQLDANDEANAKQCRYSKIHAWRLSQYERVLLLDTDTFVMQNLDELFAGASARPLAAVKDSVGDIFNTGVLLLTPNASMASKMAAVRNDVESYNKGDQGFFNNFHGNEWDSLPSKYNIPIQSADSAFVRAGLPNSLAILHFTAEVKPWNFFRSSAVKTGWKASSKVPWVYYALWHQMADSSGSRREECFSEKTLTNLAKVKNDTHFSAMISTYDRDEESLFRVVQLFDSVPETYEIFIVSHEVGRKLNRKYLQSGSSRRVTILYQSTDSLNNRFGARFAFSTTSLYVCDDDIWMPPQDLSFAHSMWRQHREQIVGFFPRWHGADGTYEYNGRRTTYSMMLTKGMFIAPEYNWVYSCAAPAVNTDLVDSFFNCEDVLMNFVVTGISGKGPVAVANSGTILDWGTRTGISSAGLAAKSAAQNDHLVSRTQCIQEFRKSFAPVDLVHNDVTLSPFNMNRVAKVEGPPQ